MKVTETNGMGKIAATLPVLIVSTLMLRQPTTHGRSGPTAIRRWQCFLEIQLGKHGMAKRYSQYLHRVFFSNVMKVIS